MKSHELLGELCRAMRDEYGAGDEFELALGELIGKARTRFEYRMRDKQAADLLPLGRLVAAERLSVAPSTVYKMVHRFRRLSTPSEAA